MHGYLKTVRQQGFTLIEVMTAMAVLVIIMLMLTRMFTEATDLSHRGTRRIYQAQEARAVLDLLSRELSQAIVGAEDEFRISGVGLEFSAATRTPPHGNNVERAAQKYDYWVEDGELIRTRNGNREFITDNVHGFEVWAALALADEDLNETDDYTWTDDHTWTDELPLWVDIEIDMLDPVAAERGGEYAERAVRRYNTRVYFRNREGTMR